MTGRADDCTIEEVLEVLDALGIRELVYRLDGGGDSGDAGLESVDWKAGHNPGSGINIDQILARIPFSFKGFAEVDGDGAPLPPQFVNVGEILYANALDMPDFDWVNNEGGSGTVTYLPEQGPDYGVCVDMSQNVYEDEEDFDEEEEDDEKLEGEGLENGEPDAGAAEAERRAVEGPEEEEGPNAEGAEGNVEGPGGIVP